MTREQWVTLLTFIAGLLALAGQSFDLSGDWSKVVTFLVAAINLGLATFFGNKVYQARQARIRAERYE